MHTFEITSDMVIAEIAELQDQLIVLQQLLQYLQEQEHAYIQDGFTLTAEF